MVSRIHSGIVYHDCHDCGLEIDESDVLWATEDGKLSVEFGEPYCDECLPEPQGCGHCSGVGGCACKGGVGSNVG